MKNKLLLLGLTLFTVPVMQANVFTRACATILKSGTKFTFFGTAGLVGSHYQLLLEAKNDFLFYKMHNRLNQHEERISSLEYRVQQLETGKPAQVGQPKPQIADNNMGKKFWQWGESLVTEENVALVTANIEAIKYSGQKYGERFVDAVTQRPKKL